MAHAQLVLQPQLYGGNGGHPNPDGTPLSINNGWIVLVDQNTGAAGPLGHPAGVGKISGLAFDASGHLWASTINGSSSFPPPLPSSLTSDLVQIDPATGALIADIGTIKVGGTPIQIADLSVQPGTGVLFGISASASGDAAPAGNLYTINTSTAVATLVGPTGDFFGAIAFAPNGTLYATTGDLDNMGNIVNTKLKTLNPLNGQTLTAVSTDIFYSALAVRYTDGVIFGGNGDGFPDALGSGLFTIDAGTGKGTLIGHPGLNFVGYFEFQPTLGLDLFLWFFFSS